MSIVYLNGTYLDEADATVPLGDRGLLLGDALYEVTPAYRGRFVRLERHLARLERGLATLRIDLDVAPLEPVHRRLMEESGMAAEPASKVYLHVTRGVAERTHAFPAEPVEPTVFAVARRVEPPAAVRWEEGFTAVTEPDLRWARVDLKTPMLLPNVLAQQAAVDAGADEAILVRDGVALEGTHANLFAVFGDRVVTHPATTRILPGITREIVLELTRERGHPVEERAIQVEEIAVADEIFLTGSTTEVRPIVALDGSPVGTGEPGPTTRGLFEAYRDRVGGEKR
ncbi:MAG: aminotransferase class IV [Gemmatimonadota bacterium]|nr:aminotransferase class IV [Gemmatimonadota bacterium]